MLEQRADDDREIADPETALSVEESVASDAQSQNASPEESSDGGHVIESLGSDPPKPPPVGTAVDPADLPPEIAAKINKPSPWVAPAAALSARGGAAPPMSIGAPSLASGPPSLGSAPSSLTDGPPSLGRGPQSLGRGQSLGSAPQSPGSPTPSPSDITHVRAQQAASPPPPPAAAAAGAALHLSSPITLDDNDVLSSTVPPIEGQHSALPFTDEKTTERHSPQQSTTAPFDNKALTAMPVEHYAALCALCGVFPERLTDTHARFGIEDNATRNQLDELWQTRFTKNSSLHQLWSVLFAQFRQWLTLHGREPA